MSINNGLNHLGSWLRSCIMIQIDHLNNQKKKFNFLIDVKLGEVNSRLLYWTEKRAYTTEFQFSCRDFSPNISQIFLKNTIIKLETQLLTSSRYFFISLSRRGYTSRSFFFKQKKNQKTKVKPRFVRRMKIYGNTRVCVYGVFCVICNGTFLYNQTKSRLMG